MRGIDKLKAGDFNNVSQEKMPNGSVLVTLYKRGEKVAYQFMVRNLYQPNEVVEWEKEVPA